MLEIEGETYHFSTITADELTSGEIYAIAEYIKDEPVQTPSDLLAYYSAMMALAEKAKALGLTYEADTCLSWAKDLVMDYTPELLNDPLAPNPCGYNSIDVEQWANLVVSVIGNGSEADQVRARACTLNVAPQFLFLSPGETWQHGLTATLLDPASNQRACSILNWYSSNLNAVEITSTTNNSCVVTAVGGAEATANIYANCDGLLGYAKVVVRPAVVVVEPMTKTIKVGETFTFTATAKDNEGNPVSPPLPVDKWATSNPTVASLCVSGAVGCVVGNSPGTATITATIAGATGSAIVTVRSAVTSVTVDPPRGSIDPGTGLNLTATAKDAQGNTILPSENSISWTTSDPKVALLVWSGMQATVSGMSPGEALITVDVDGIQGTAKVYVRVTSITVSPETEVRVPYGGKVQFTATGKDAAGKLWPGIPVSWSLRTGGVGDGQTSVDNTGLFTSTQPGHIWVEAQLNGVSGYGNTVVYGTQTYFGVVTLSGVGTYYGPCPFVATQQWEVTLSVVPAGGWYYWYPRAFAVSSPCPAYAFQQTTGPHLNPWYPLAVLARGPTLAIPFDSGWNISATGTISDNSFDGTATEPSSDVDGHIIQGVVHLTRTDTMPPPD